MITFAIVRLGHIKHRINLDRVRRWPSKLFRVSGISTCHNIPDGRLGWQTFNDEDLGFVNPVPGADITVALTEYALADNFYIRHRPGPVLAMSFYEVADILEWQSIPLEHFVVRNLYEICLVWHLYGREQLGEAGLPDIIHDETRSCLFDMNGPKGDIVFSTARPSLCDQCRARLAGNQIPDEVIRNLDRELRRIRRPLYYRLAGFVRQHPLLSSAIALGTGLGLAVAGNAAYDLVRWLLVDRNQ